MIHSEELLGLYSGAEEAIVYAVESENEQMLRAALSNNVNTILDALRFVLANAASDAEIKSGNRRKLNKLEPAQHEKIVRKVARMVCEVDAGGDVEHAELLWGDHEASYVNDAEQILAAAFPLLEKQAREDERERCARIAERVADANLDENREATTGSSVAQHICNCIRIVDLTQHSQDITGERG